MSVTVVIGAGIAGISAAYHLKLAGAKVKCFEASDKVGGLLSSFEIDGYRFDNAVHLSFTKNEYVRSIFDKTPYYSHKPNSFCYESGKWLRHPVQNNLYPLSAEEKVELISSFYDAPKSFDENYRSWLICQYGEKIAERYPINYTKRYWGIEPSCLSLTWIGERVRKGDVKEILKGAFENRDDNHYYASEMRYPKIGGYFSFIREMAEYVHATTHKRVVEVDANKKLITFSDGCHTQYQNLINTMPLPELIRVMRDVPEDVRHAAQSLLYTKIDLISVGFSRVIESQHLWFYIYNDCVAARAYSPSQKSPDSVPVGCSSLQFEIYHLSTSASPDEHVLIADVKRYLVDSQLCHESDIMFMHHKRLEYGNVVYDIGMEERRDLVVDYLAKQGVYTAGRFGEWAYFWSDQSLISGKSAAEKVLEGLSK